MSILDVHPGYSAWWIYDEELRFMMNDYAKVDYSNTLHRAMDSAFAKGSYQWNNSLLETKKKKFDMIFIYERTTIIR